MKAVVDQNICQDQGFRVLSAPRLFVPDDETGLAIVASETIGSGKRAALTEAMNSRLINAITLIEN